MNYEQAIEHLRPHYDASATKRDKGTKTDWKLTERAHFLEYVRRLETNRPLRLLEVGAGTGQDGVFFRDNGLDVICTDLSPEMAACCRAKGLTAYVADFLSLPFADSSFDALYALNCLLHVPRADLPRVLARLHRVLKPGGLFYLGVYGGENCEGVFDFDGTSNPEGRFFAYHTTESLIASLASHFQLLYFRAVPLGNTNREIFQSFIAQAR